MKKIIFTIVFLLLFMSSANKVYAAIEIVAPTSARKGEEINVSISGIERTWWIMVELLDSDGRQADNREFEGETSVQIKLTMPTTGFSPAILRVCRRLGSLPVSACDNPDRMELLKTQLIEIVVAPSSTPTQPPPPPAAGGEEGIDFGKLSGAIPSLKPIFQAGPASNVGGIISTVLPYLFVFAGLLLLFYLIYGGFHMMIAAGDEKGLALAKGKITNALVGFLLLFISYWLVQIVEYVLGIQIF